MEFKLPSPLSLDGNVSDNFNRFIASFKIYLKASGHENKSSDVKAAILLNALGEDAIDLFYTFDLKDEERNEYDAVLKAFETYVKPKTNVVVERFKFNCRNQQPGESFDHFMTDLKKLIKSCDFGDQSDSLLRDRIVLGISDKSLQERILREVDLTLEKTVKLCRATELGRKQAEELQEKSQPVGLAEIGLRTSHTVGAGASSTTERPVSKTKNVTNKSKTKNNVSSYDCKKCGQSHGPASCPAYGKKCNNCQRMNHFAIGCRLKKVKAIESNSVGLTNANSVTQSEPNDVLNLADRLYLIDTISRPKPNEAVQKTQWFETILLNDQLNVSFKLDSGAEVSVLPLTVFASLRNSNKDVKLEPTKLMLEAYGGGKIKPLGTVKLLCKTKKSSTIVEFVVTNISKPNNETGILGLKACQQLDLIRRVETMSIVNTPKEMFIKNNLDLFEGVGNFGTKCHFDIKEDANVTVKPPRRIPLALQPKVKQALDDLETQGVIAKVDSPKSFVSNLVVVEKANGSVRLCIDPQDLNKVTKRTPHLIPSIEDMSDKLSNKSVYSVLDLKNGFYHVELDNASAEHCGFSTPFGTYKFLRLPFGLNIAPEIFQKLNEQIFSGIKGLVVYFDDLLCSGADEKEHDEMMNEIVKRARQFNVKFNKDKLQYKVDSVKYFGHVFSSKGCSPDPDRIRAVTAVKSPSNKKELQSILGLFNYLRPFVPNMASLTSPLRELLKKDVTFCWLSQHQKALDNLKEIITKAPALASFDSKKPISLQCDSSKDGMGFTLMQDGRPVMYGSRSLSETQKGYSQIEKEMLSIVEATKKYHHFIYGRQMVEVQTDHKPIVSIMNKTIASINNSRLQRMRVKLLKYNLNVIHVPGKEMYIADLLSRSYIDESCDDPELNEVVHTLSKYVQVTDQRKAEIQQHSVNDETLCNVSNFVQNGWPTDTSKIPIHTKFFMKFQDRLTVDDGLVFLDHRIIIPVTLRSKILSLLHESHMGIEKTKMKARLTVYWPNINADIENIVNKCSICEKYRNCNVKEPLEPHSVPELPFEKVGIDILESQGKPYLVLVDYYSKWLELIQLKSMQANECISKLKTIFSTHGIPKVVCCDNMPFGSFEFRSFAKDWDFECCYSSPRYPKSNGMAERAVQIAKNILKKSQNESQILVGLLEYRSTPVKGTGLAPSQALMSRVLRTKVPICNSVLKPKVQSSVKESILSSQSKSKLYYDRNAKPRKELTQPNVVYKKDGVWKPAKIIGKGAGPRSYLIEEENGRVLRRNTFHLRPSLNEPIPRFVENDIELDNAVLNDNNQPNEGIQNEIPNNNVEIDHPMNDPVNVRFPNNNVNNEQVQVPINGHYQTRSGRVVKPPKRFS